MREDTREVGRTSNMIERELNSKVGNFLEFWFIIGSCYEKLQKSYIPR